MRSPIKDDQPTTARETIKTVATKQADQELQKSDRPSRGRPKAINPACPYCESESNKFGRDREGKQRFRCKSCKKMFVFTDKHSSSNQKLKTWEEEAANILEDIDKI